MSDRELMEKAAKAAGYQIDARASFMTWRDSRRLALLNPQGGHTLWNADEDDGDALRLAIRCAVLFGFYRMMRAWLVAMATENGDPADPYAATRRAVMRAAAALLEGAE